MENSQLFADILQSINQAKETLRATNDSVAVRQETLERAVNDISMKMSAMQEVVSRHGQHNIDEDSPQANHIIRNYGRVTFPQLVSTVTAHKDDRCVQGLQERADMVYMLGMWKYMSMSKRGKLGNQYNLQDVIKSTKLYETFNNETEPLRRALSTGGTGTGLEFVPTEFTMDLVDRVNLGLKVAALHRRVTVPRSPYVFPAKVAANPMGFKVAERTTDNLLTQANQLPALTPGTRNVTLTAVGIGGLVIFSTEEEEDSIIPILPFARDELVLAMQNAMETSVLNGDNAATHSDNDVATGAGVATDPRTAWDGYRVMSIAPSTDTTLDMATFSVANFRALRTKMGKYGVNPANLAITTSPKTYLGKFLEIDEVSTVDLMGPNAVILTGQLGALDGIPIVVSEFSRDDVSSTGFNTIGGPNTKSVFNIIYRNGIIWGDVRELRVIDFAWPLSDQVVVMVKGRMSFTALYDVSTETIVSSGINI